MLLEELIEQHRVDLLISNRLRLTLVIAPHQIGIYFGHFLRDQTKGNRLRLVILLVVAKADRLKLIDRFAGCVQWLNVMLVSAGRDVCSAESAIAVNRDQVWVSPDLRLNVGIDLTDEATVADI
jgi:hypothetical protein